MKKLNLLAEYDMVQLIDIKHVIMNFTKFM